MTNSNNQQLELSFLTQSTVEATPAEMRQELRLEEQKMREILKEKQQNLMSFQAELIEWYRDKYISCINQNQTLQSLLLNAQAQNEELNLFIKKHQCSLRHDNNDGDKYGGRDHGDNKGMNSHQGYICEQCRNKNALGRNMDEQTQNEFKNRLKQLKKQNQIVLQRIQRLDRQNRGFADKVRDLSVQERKDKETIRDLQLQQEQAQKIIRNMSVQETKDKETIQKLQAQERKDQETTKQLEVEVEMLKSQLGEESQLVKELQNRLYKVGEHIKDLRQTRLG